MSERAEVYRYAGITLSSELPLPLEPLPQAPAPDLRVRVGGRQPELGRVIRRFASPDGEWLTLRHSGSAVAYCFPDLATFLVEPTGGVEVHPGPHVQENTLVHLLLEQVLPLHLVTRGHHVLHASSVAVGAGDSARAVLFIGPSGAGKSSTALGCHLSGARLLGDDFAVLTGPTLGYQLVPAELGLRLWSDVVASARADARVSPVAEYTTKVRVRPSSAPRRAPRPVDVGAVICLGPRTGRDSEVDLQRVGPAEATVEVAQQSYRVEMSDLHANARLLERAAALVQAVPVFRATLPAGLDELTRACNRLLEMVAEPASLPAPLGVSTSR